VYYNNHISNQQTKGTIMDKIIWESIDRKERIVYRNFWYTTETRHFQGGRWSRVSASRTFSA
jgi:hypothetical protein